MLLVEKVEYKSKKKDSKKAVAVARGRSCQ